MGLPCNTLNFGHVEGSGSGFRVVDPKPDVYYAKKIIRVQFIDYSCFPSGSMSGARRAADAMGAQSSKSGQKVEGLGP